MREAAVIRGRLGDLAGERADLEKRLEATTLEAPALIAALETAREAMRTAEADLEASRAMASELDGARRQAAEREIEARTALDHLTARVNSLRGVLVARGELQPNHTFERRRPQTAHDPRIAQRRSPGRRSVDPANT